MTLTLPRLPLERTWIARDLAIDELAARKAELGQTVSVVLPARNEAGTIEGVVRACLELSGSLVDELVVIDGGSEDATVALAAEAGAIVYSDTLIMPEYGPGLGKGDALWRSLAVTKGDIVVYLDTDIRNPHPRFVYGLLGPLLADPGLALVKAFYDRPVEIGKILHPSGGGRVTELLARPLLNLFWPPLASLVQPLSGEYAGRRDLLEQLPFFTGYGVELGMLIDTLRIAGAEAIGQVDLEERIHRNQDLEALSRMAFGIAQVAARRLVAEGRLAEGVELPHHYAQFTRTQEGVGRVSHQIEIVERPPLRSLNRA
jgi:glucosyl-3-phosphoglycerate synthase